MHVGLVPGHEHTICKEAPCQSANAVTRVTMVAPWYKKCENAPVDKVLTRLEHDALSGLSSLEYSHGLNIS